MLLSARSTIVRNRPVARLRISAGAGCLPSVGSSKPPAPTWPTSARNTATASSASSARAPRPSSYAPPAVGRAIDRAVDDRTARPALRNPRGVDVSADATRRLPSGSRRRPRRPGAEARHCARNLMTDLGDRVTGFGRRSRTHRTHGHDRPGPAGRSRPDLLDGQPVLPASRSTAVSSSSCSRGEVSASDNRAGRAPAV